MPTPSGHEGDIVSLDLVVRTEHCYSWEQDQHRRLLETRWTRQLRVAGQNGTFCEVTRVRCPINRSACVVSYVLQLGRFENIIISHCFKCLSTSCSSPK